MKKVIVTGGTGNLGSKIVEYLIEKKYTTTVLTSKSVLNPINGVNNVTADITCKDSLTSLFDDTDVIIHCASNPRKSDDVDVMGTKNILENINLQKPPHFIYISIVGVDKSNWPYYQNKYKTENLIKSSRIPYTILRITQFHDFVLNRIVKDLDTKPIEETFKIPKGLCFQSIDTGEAAKRIVSYIDTIQKTEGSIITFGGPEVLPLQNIVKIYLAKHKRNQTIETYVTDDPFYKIFTTGINLCPDYKNGKTTWKAYIEDN